MSETENTKIIIFGTFGVPKSIFYPLLIAMVLGSASLSFAFIETTSQTNQDFPDQQKKQIEIDKKASDLRIDIEVMKDKMNHLEIGQQEMRIDFKEGFKEVFKQLHEINRQTK